MSKQFWSKVAEGVAELVIESPPVNALDSVGWRTFSQEIDALHLQLQNLYYEQRHLRGEIAGCEDYE